MSTYYRTISISLSVDSADGKKPSEMEIAFAKLAHGKFTTHSGDHEHEMQISTVNSRTFSKGKDIWVDACSRDNALNGTEGSFEIWNVAPLVWASGASPFPSSPDSHRIVRVNWKMPDGKILQPQDEPTMDVKESMSGYYDVSWNYDVSSTDERDALLQPYVRATINGSIEIIEKKKP